MGEIYNKNPLIQEVCFELFSVLWSFSLLEMRHFSSKAFLNSPLSLTSSTVSELLNLKLPPINVLYFLLFKTRGN